jgi:hypothetical protein
MMVNGLHLPMILNHHRLPMNHPDQTKSHPLYFY